MVLFGLKTDLILHHVQGFTSKKNYSREILIKRKRNYWNGTSKMWKRFRKNGCCSLEITKWVLIRNSWRGGTNWFSWVLWHINHCWLFSAKSRFCFILSELFSVARQARFLKLESKPGWLKHQSKILPLSHEETSASEGNLNAYVSHLFTYICFVIYNSVGCH